MEADIFTQEGNYRMYFKKIIERTPAEVDPAPREVEWWEQHCLVNVGILLNKKADSGQKLCLSEINDQAYQDKNSWKDREELYRTQ